MEDIRYIFILFLIKMEGDGGVCSFLMFIL